MMRIKDVLLKLEQWAPIAHQESYDNSGLLTGDTEAVCSGVLVALDCTEAVLMEALAKGCNLIVAHHPIVFGAMKKFTGADYVSRVIRMAIKKDLAIYAIHTNLDNVHSGVNARMAQALQMRQYRILRPQKGRLRKLVTFVPDSHQQEVLAALFEAGAGQIGAYSECSFSFRGTGTFKGGGNTQPFVGQAGVRHHEEEVCIQVIVPDYLTTKVTVALEQAHPYEEVAFDWFVLENDWAQIGSGMVGELPEPMSAQDFMGMVKREFKASVIRHTNICRDKIQRVAVCGGSGFFLLQDAIRAKADVFITSDIKYHQFFDADNQLIVMDIGHFESEQFTIDLIGGYLKENLPTFAILLSETNTNPVNYF
jgi:dinuclear metal center YbgI/SA1388 family protein